MRIECIRLLEECDIIIALIDDNDTGTAFEAGYAHAVNKPVILISQGDCSSANAMLIGSAKMAADNILEKGQINRKRNRSDYMETELATFCKMEIF